MGRREKTDIQAILLNNHLLELLLGQLGELLEHLSEVLTVGIGLEVLLALLGGLGGDHDHTGRALGGSGGTELGAGGDEDVGDTVVLAQDGNVRDNIHGGDIGSENDDTAGDIDLSVGGGNGRFAESLDDFLNTALEGLVDSG